MQMAAGEICVSSDAQKVPRLEPLSPWNCKARFACHCTICRVTYVLSCLYGARGSAIGTVRLEKREHRMHDVPGDFLRKEQMKRISSIMADVTIALLMDVG